MEIVELKVSDINRLVGTLEAMLEVQHEQRLLLEDLVFNQLGEPSIESEHTETDLDRVDNPQPRYATTTNAAVILGYVKPEWQRPLDNRKIQAGQMRLRRLIGKHYRVTEDPNQPYEIVNRALPGSAYPRYMFDIQRCIERDRTAVSERGA